MAHVLLINDEPDLLEICEDILRSVGHSVTRAVGEPNALIAAADSHPDVVVLDLVMPGTSGEEVLRRFREALPEADTPVVVMSALEEGPERAREMDADGFLAKPFEPDALIGAVEEALMRGRGRIVNMGSAST
jgi:CheY-like chemotaxis protein